MRKFMLASASFLAVAFWSASATAQSTSQDDDESVGEASDADEGEDEGGDDENTIVVTGTFYGSLLSAIQEKRIADSIVDVIAAENLGKLPEVSIAESISRLPGVVAQRDRGNASALSVRGLGPSLTSTFLNGRELATGEPTRNIRYDVYPAELLSGAYVYKSPVANRPEGGIGGTIDLRTIRPLDSGETKLVGTFRYNVRPLDDDITNGVGTGFVANAAYVDQFFDDRLGIALGAAYQELPSSSREATIYPYRNSFQDIDGDGTVFEGIDPNGFDGDLIPFGWTAIQGAGVEERLGLVGALQFKISDELQLNGDIFYTENSNVDERFGFRVENIAFGTTIANPVVVDNYLIAADITQTASFGTSLRTVAEISERDEDAIAGGLNLEWSRNGFNVALDASYSENNRYFAFSQIRTEVHDASGAIPVPVTSGVFASFRSYPDRPADFAFNIDLTDPSINLPTAYTAYPNDVKDQIYGLALDASYQPDASFFTDLQFGVRYTDRRKQFDRARDERFLSVADRVPLPANVLTGPARFTGGDFANVPPVLAYDFNAALDAVFGGPMAPSNLADLANGYDIREDILSGYANAEFASSLGSVPFNGNIGLRVTGTKTDASGFDYIVVYPVLPNGSLDFANPTITNRSLSVQKGYTEFLPSVNVNFELARGLNLRLAASRQMARPALDAQRPGLREFVDFTPEAFGGNAELDPFIARAYDASLEWYFMPGSQFSIAGFYKDIETYIVNLTRANQTLPSGATGPITQPINGEGGSIKGFEVALTHKFTYLPSPLDGFGIWANYSLTESNIEIAPTFGGGTFPLPGLTKDAANLSVFFEKAGFEARVGYRYVGDYSLQIGDDSALRFAREYQSVDAQVSYKFPPNSGLQGWSLLVQGSNLTNEPFRTRFLSQAASGSYTEYGASYWFGISYQM